MAIHYPDWLPIAQKANKNATTDTGFRSDQPTVGAPIFQRLTDDLKTTFSLTWLFKSRAEHRAFMQWLRSPNYLDNCNQWFIMGISTGAGDTGVEPQELHFTAYPTWNQSGNTYTWTGNVICRQLQNSDDDYDDVVVELPPTWASWLDIVVTETLPKVP